MGTFIAVRVYTLSSCNCFGGPVLESLN